MLPKYRLTLTEEELIELEKELVNSTNPMLLKVAAAIRVQLVKIQNNLVKPAFIASSTSGTRTVIKSSTANQPSIEELRHAAYKKLCELGQENLNSIESELAFTYMYFNDLFTEEQKTAYEERYLGV